MPVNPTAIGSPNPQGFGSGGGVAPGDVVFTPINPDVKAFQLCNGATVNIKNPGGFKHRTTPSDTAISVASVTGAATNHTAVAWGNGQFVTCLGDGSIYTSGDAVSSWTFKGKAPTSFTSMAYGNGVWVGVNGSGTAVWSSTDLTTWTQRTSGVSYALTQVRWNGSIFKAGGNASAQTYSLDGINWNATNGGGSGANIYTIAVVPNTGTIIAGVGQNGSDGYLGFQLSSAANFSAGDFRASGGYAFAVAAGPSPFNANQYVIIASTSEGYIRYGNAVNAMPNIMGGFGVVYYSAIYALGYFQLFYNGGVHQALITSGGGLNIPTNKGTWPTSFSPNLGNAVTNDAGDRVVVAGNTGLGVVTPATNVFTVPNISPQLSNGQTVYPYMRIA